MALLNDKSAWILKKLQENASKNTIEVNLEDEVLLFGEIYSIDSEEATLTKRAQNCISRRR